MAFTLTGAYDPQGVKPMDMSNLPPSAQLLPPGFNQMMQPGNAMYQPQPGNAQAGINLHDFAAILNPGIRNVGWSGQAALPNGTDPGSLFNNPNFHSLADQIGPQATAMSQGGTAVNQWNGLFSGGKLGQSAPAAQYPQMPDALSPGQAVNVPVSYGRTTPMVDFGHIMAGKVNRPGSGLNSGIFNNGQPVTNLLNPYAR